MLLQNAGAVAFHVLRITVAAIASEAAAWTSGERDALAAELGVAGVGIAGIGANELTDAVPVGVAIGAAGAGRTIPAEFTQAGGLTPEQAAVASEAGRLCARRNRDAAAPERFVAIGAGVAARPSPSQLADAARLCAFVRAHAAETCELGTAGKRRRHRILAAREEDERERARTQSSKGSRSWLRHSKTLLSQHHLESTRHALRPPTTRRRTAAVIIDNASRRRKAWRLAQRRPSPAAPATCQHQVAQAMLTAVRVARQHRTASRGEK